VILDLQQKKRDFMEALVEWNERVKFGKKCSLWVGTATLVARVVQLHTLTSILGGVCVGCMVYLIHCFRKYNRCVKGLEIINNFETKPAWLSVLNAINEGSDGLHKTKK
jgi:hypothetical protein